MILVALLAAPLAGAAVLLAPVTRRPGPGDTARIMPLYGVVVSGVTLALALIAAAAFDYGRAGRMQLQVDREWIPGLDLRFHLGVDGISLPLVVLTALLTFLCFVYLLRHRPARGRLAELAFTLLALEVGMIGTFLALDLLLFFVFFEIVLIPMYFVIAVWGGTERRAAAVKFILYTLLGSAVLLLGLLLVWSHAGTLDMVRLAERHGDGIPRAAQILAFLAVGAGLAVKAPMWPLHTWLPAAHTEAPTVGSVLLAGVLLKMGTYGFARIAIPVLPDGAAALAPWLGAFAVTGIIYGSLACLAQRDLKRLIAYSSVGHMGFVLLGLATLTPAGMNAALFGNIAHGLITGLLFFTVGSLKDRYHTADLSPLPTSHPTPSGEPTPAGLSTPSGELTRSGELPPSGRPATLPGGRSATLPSGLLGTSPYLSSVLTFACVASLGLPGLAGFWGELLSLLAAFDPAPGLSRPLYLTYMALGGIGTILTAAYFLRTLSRITHGPPVRAAATGEPSAALGTAASEEPPAVPDVTAYELAAWTPLVVLILALGLWPKALLAVTDPAVRALLGAP
ncbi:NADH-quinone oxidoreductase subunit M [Sphaerisporangium rubeum]|uniref:NADH-quinone oxidoreductase subunit M n=1 Tax=Sphaerisporangium rubeum TaxID=321317 RepID=A0A7X0M657_9ACTN|nr:NADH-quinone oxidoreductase subunit M [Sphaerisporangium rubeum]MBB6471516.1 NADH-quinone oxidoreductase subunit M [Sphaerisporangium rubeum]